MIKFRVGLVFSIKTIMAVKRNNNNNYNNNYSNNNNTHNDSDNDKKKM